MLTVPESQLDAVTALSGSGPAYFFLMVEALVDAGVAVGLSRAGGHRPDRADDGRVGGDAAGTDGSGPANGRWRAVGTGVDATAAQLRATVTSPGGTTAAGLRELERGGLRAAVDAAVEAAKTRSEQLRITSE